MCLGYRPIVSLYFLVLGDLKVPHHEYQDDQEYQLVLNDITSTTPTISLTNTVSLNLYVSVKRFKNVIQ